MNYNLITILGPTAVGKTRLGAILANKFDGEIISADSRQVYKGMDIGTGKDLSDYVVDGKAVPYHLIDVIEPGGEFNLFMFNQLFFKCFEDVTSRNKIPFLVGGTGLYLHSILKSYELNKVEFENNLYKKLSMLDVAALQKRLLEINPTLHNTTDLLIKDRIIKAIIVAGDKKRENVEEKVKINSLVVGVNVERKIVRERITKRLKYRLENGMIDEVKKLIDNGITIEKLEFFGLEYKFVAKHLNGEITFEEMFKLLNTAIHQFAKRQMTWFRKMEKEGLKIYWIQNSDYEAAENIITGNYFNGR